jgi:polyhydroxyalkanoate synthesis regulator phasin
MAKRVATPMNMKTSPRLFVVLACALSLAGASGCSKRDASSSAAPPSVAAAPGVGGTTASPKPLAVGRALIVTEDIRVTVSNIDDAATRLRTEVDRAGGYVADSSTGGKGEDRTASFQLRVPADKVRDVRSALAGVGEVTSDNEKVQDVTEERADLKARLHNARVQEKRILEIMTSKTGTIAEVIAAETELARIRESIERLEAQERSLDGRIDLATINVTMRAPSIAAWQTPGKSIAEAGNAGLHAAAAFFTYAAMTFVACAPTLAPFVALGFAIVVIVRRRRRGQDAMLIAASR